MWATSKEEFPSCIFRDSPAVWSAEIYLWSCKRRFQEDIVNMDRWMGIRPEESERYGTGDGWFKQFRKN